MGSLERNKELKLNNVCNGSFNKDLDFSTIHLFQDTITPNIKRLGKIQGMCRKADSNNVVLLAVLLEYGG